MRQAGLTVQRWPGGCEAHHYNWHNTVGPLADRPNMLWGLPEFMTYCEATHSLPLITLAVSIALVIYQAMTWPILMSDSSYASIFIVITYTQLVHLALLLVAAIGIWNRGNRGKLDDNYNHATVVGYFWYWVALTALLGAGTTFFVR